MKKAGFRKGLLNKSLDTYGDISPFYTLYVSDKV